MVRSIEWNNDIQPSDLSDASRRLLPLPEFGQYGLNAYSMVNFSPVVERIAAIVEPRSMCEIGIDKGEQSAFLKELSRRHGASLTLVDPVIPDELREDLLSDDDRGAVIIEERASHDYLRDGPPHDIYLIDGDHNHVTVAGELALIDRATTGRSCVVLLHDVGWPFGYRDMYYEMDRVDEPRPSRVGHLSPFASEIVDSGLPFSMSVAEHEGGPGNGVMAAVEDFLASSDRKWEFFWINVYFGLGVLWDAEKADARLTELLGWYRGAVDLLRPVLGHIELNRLMLLMRLTHAGEVWARQKAEIDRLRARLDATEES